MEPINIYSKYPIKVKDNIMEIINFHDLPDNIVDKEFLCLSCYSRGQKGTIRIVSFVENFCSNCLRYIRNPKGPIRESLEHMTIRVINETALSLNVGAILLLSLREHYGMGPILEEDERKALITLTKEVFGYIYSHFPEMIQNVLKDVYDFCLQPKSLLHITNYYIDLHNESCLWGDINLKLIAGIYVKNLFGYHTYNLTMKEPLSIIIGTNGLGKTTIFNILKAILIFSDDYYELYRKLEYILSVPFDEMVIGFIDGTTIELIQQTEGNNKKLLFKLSPMQDDYCVFEINAKFKKKYRELFKDFPKSISGEIQLKCLCEKDLSFTVSSLSQIYIPIVSTFPKLESKGNKFLFIKTKRLDMTELKASIATLPQDQETLERIKQWSNCFARLYYEGDPSQKHIRVSKNNKIIVKNSDNKRVPLSRLSSGERSALVILYQIIFKTGTNSVILIDEPEISLHIAWQQLLGEMIQEIIGQKDGAQVIIATHSPFFAAANNDFIVEAELL